MLFTQAITILFSVSVSASAVAVHAADDVNHLLSSPSGGLRHAQKQMVESANHLELRVLQTKYQKADNGEAVCPEGTESNP